MLKFYYQPETARRLVRPKLQPTMVLLKAFVLLAGAIAVVSAKSDLWTSTKDFSNFNVIKNLWNNINVTNDPAGGLLNFDKAIKVEFPRGTYASKNSPTTGKPGGLAFYAKPGPNIFNRDSVALNYKVYFPKNFEWAKGGKLPGLYSKFGQSGGHTDDPTGFSYRVMWRAGGQAEAYVYAPSRQDPSIERIPGYFADGTIGQSIGRGVQTFLADQWNTVKVFIKLNSIQNGRPIADGILKLIINGKPAVDFSKMIWRSRADVQIEGVMFQTFFGGNDVSYAPTKDTFIAFKSFSLTEQ
ncbi:hypothetical protein BV898_19089 [Hypsibius exemplaris]|uniref:Polysaccharide lyase 14 domain-containing protein n=1 Tax=Hypsibius exemplaris TaxID=2072580 RepID=A0A9X6NI21_HYPEX|nr:hypothetical protein BV898_19089 [Hypsibius exemplaris]